MNRDRILLLLENKGNRRLLAEVLGTAWQTAEGDDPAALRQPFDLCITDGVTLARMHDAVAARKRAEPGLFLPFLLVTARHDVGVGSRRLWESVDELIGVPIEKVELTARVEILLRARRLSRQNFELRRALENELAHASRVQAALLPDAAPKIAGFEIAARCLPAREVGGDFYDWEPIGTGKLSFTLGDVCGKGMPAALLMATIRATLRAVWHQNAPAKALALAHHALAVDFERSAEFVTLFLGALDADARMLRFVDAGHGHLFLRRRNGAIEGLEPRGMPFGVFGEQSYEEGTLRFDEGDALVVYSDGLTEIHHDAVTSDDAIAERLDGVAGAEKMVERLIDGSREVESLPDDLTVMVLQCTGER